MVVAGVGDLGLGQLGRDRVSPGLQARFYFNARRVTESRGLWCLRLPFTRSGLPLSKPQGPYVCGGDTSRTCLMGRCED